MYLRSLSAHSGSVWGACPRAFLRREIRFCLILRWEVGIGGKECWRSKSVNQEIKKDVGLDSRPIRCPFFRRKCAKKTQKCDSGSMSAGSTVAVKKWEIEGNALWLAFRLSIVPQPLSILVAFVHFHYKELKDDSACGLLSFKFLPLYNQTPYNPSRWMGHARVNVMRGRSGCEILVAAQTYDYGAVCMARLYAFGMHMGYEGFDSYAQVKLSESRPHPLW